MQVLLYLALFSVTLLVRAKESSWVKPDLSTDCLECQAMMEVIYKTFTDEDTMDSMIQKIEKGCEKLPDKAVETCDRILETLVSIPGSLFHGMEDLAWPIPTATCAFAKKCKTYCCNDLGMPEQIHLSLASTDRSLMGVSWVTLEEGEGSVVQWGKLKSQLGKSAQGGTGTYTQGNWVGTIHRAVMNELEHDTEYFYRVGDGSFKWSKTYSFRTLPVDAASVTFAVIADMGYAENSDNTVKSLTALVEKGEIDVVIHSGDLGYADGYMPHWDVFFNKIEPIAARVPYMVTPGNHEFFANFSAYKHRFFMPGAGLGLDDGGYGGSGDGMFYAWDAGKAHFVALNSETPIDTGNFKEEMIDWAAKDMAAVNRNNTPWLMTHFHRPLYCSNDHNCDFTSAGHLRMQAERTFKQAGVDLAFCGHLHAYERTAPVFLGKTMPVGTAPVYIVQGASGNREGNKGAYPDEHPDWSLARYTDIGYALMTVEEGSVTWRFYNSETNELLDETVLQKR